MEWRSVSPKRGDIVRTKVSFYCHYGVFVSEDEVIQFGLPDDPGRPANEIHVLTSDIYTFLAGGDVEVAHPSREEVKKCAHVRRLSDAHASESARADMIFFTTTVSTL